eukprot:gene3466-13526_t
MLTRGLLHKSASRCNRNSGFWLGFVTQSGREAVVEWVDLCLWWAQGTPGDPPAPGGPLGGPSRSRTRTVSTSQLGANSGANCSSPGRARAPRTFRCRSIQAAEVVRTADMSEPNKREKLEPDGLTPLERSMRKLQKPSSSSRPDIGPVPASSVLGRLKDFLPGLAAANQKLEAEMKVGQDRPASEFDIEADRPASEFDIEAVSASQENEEAPVIQMDLMCGLLDLKNEESIRAAERAALEGSLAAEHSSTSDDESSDMSSDEEEDEGQEGKEGCSQGDVSVQPGHVHEAAGKKLPVKRGREVAEKETARIGFKGKGKGKAGTGKIVEL